MNSDRALYLYGGVAAVVGSLLGMVGNLIHPVTPMNDPQGVAHVIAESEAWFGIHFVIVIGIGLMLGGLVALGRSISDGPARALSRLGLFAGTVGITIGLILVILDGVAARELAKEWASAPAEQKPMALQVMLGNETVNFALASLFNLIFAGATYILFGLAVALSDVYPKWMGWIAVAAGIGSVCAGFIQGTAGVPTTTSRILTIIGPTVITLWTATIGLLLIRKSRT
jgi:Domain of unknown function (DUF4386)